ncbi:hypothetical protein C9446_14220 [Providencia heimbachae]|uniref:hypothetical protein n=1 Tax=Providencia heimbachae TaxID=333962 RepID=UPI0010BF2C9A|nr:hypothetical protein [Providencia heimbachae]QCJ70905.1 hypothetical protein C9446_14220 [Providencia heimbachae]
MANELVVIEQENRLSIFTEPEKAGSLLLAIKAKAKQKREELGELDLSKKVNREKLISLAYEVTRSKTYIESKGKELAAELKEIPKKIDAARAEFKKELDTLASEIKKPADDWVIAEEERIVEEEQKKKAEEERVKAEELARIMPYLHAEALEMNAEHDKLIAEAKAEAERKRIAYEDELKRQAAEQAKLEAELKAKQEKEAAELKAKQEIEAATKREREAKEAQERAEREKLEAIQRAEQAAKDAKEKAEREKLAAIEAERKKQADIEAERLAEEERKRQEDVKRQANKKHQKEINNQAMQDLIDAGIPEECAKSCIIAIAKNLVSNVKIHY